MMIHLEIKYLEKAEGYEFLSFAKSMGKNIGKNISQNLSGKYSRKRFHYAKESATDALKTASKREIQKLDQNQLQMSMMEKYLKEYILAWKKG